jgi:hypothetical protein
MIDESTRPEQADELDGVLRAYFHSELPRPWPEAPVPVGRTLPTRPPASRRSGLRSHLALAASVAVVALGALFAAGKIAPDAGPGPRLEKPNADVPPYLRPARRDKIKTSMSLEQDPAGPTTIKVEAVEVDVPPPR